MRRNIKIIILIFMTTAMFFKIDSACALRVPISKGKSAYDFIMKEFMRRLPIFGHKRVELKYEKSIVSHRIVIADVEVKDEKLIRKVLSIDRSFNLSILVPSIIKGDYKLIAAFDFASGDIISYSIYYHLKGKPNGICIYRISKAENYTNKRVFNLWLKYYQEKFNHIELILYVDPNLPYRFEIDKSMRTTLERRNFIEKENNKFIWEKSLGKIKDSLEVIDEGVMISN